MPSRGCGQSVPATALSGLTRMHRRPQLSSCEQGASQRWSAKKFGSRRPRTGVIMDVVAGFGIVVLAVALAGSPQQPNGPAAPAGESARRASEDAIQLPVSLERIQEAISRPPALKTTTDRPVFRVEIFAPKPTIE